MRKEPLYFGCKDVTGHYVWSRNGQRKWDNPDDEKDIVYLLQSQDGKLCPKNNREQGATSIFYHIFHGEFFYDTILACHDYSVDKRPGSNAMFLLPGLLTFEEAVLKATEYFPDIMQRIGKLTLATSETHSGE